VAKKIQSKTGMSIVEGAGWWFAIFLTCGLAYPLYRARKHKADRTTVTVIP
jgi:hypothetical protein